MKIFLKNLSILIGILLTYIPSKPVLAMNFNDDSNAAQSHAIIPYQPPAQIFFPIILPHQRVYFARLPSINLHADLRLPVYIAPEILFYPSFTPGNGLHFLPDKDSSSSETEPKIYGVSGREQGDYIRLVNIRRILTDSAHFHGLNLLRQLSWQIDGMHVFRKLLRDRHKIGPTKEADPWELLTFLHHGLDYPDVSDKFGEELILNLQPFITRLPNIIDDILTIEQKRANLLEILTNQVKNTTKELYQTYIKREFKDKAIDEDILEEFCILSNEPDKMFEDVERTSLLSPELQFNLSWDIAYRYATLHQNWDAIEDLNDLKARLEVNSSLLSAKIHALPETSNFVRLCGILYEVVSLERLQNLTLVLNNLKVQLPQNLLDETQADLTFAFLKQAIVYFGEALDDINTPLEPDLAANDDILALRYVIKWLRNRLEHPELGRNKDLPSPRMRQSTLRSSPHFSSIMEGIIDDLLEIGNKLEKRLAYLKSILSCSTDEVSFKLSTIMGRPALAEPFENEFGMIKTKYPNIVQMSATVREKKARELLKQPHWTLEHPLPTLHQLRRYFINPSYVWLPIPIAQNDLNTAATAAIAAEKDKEKKDIFDSTLEDARASINQIRQLIGMMPAELLAHKFNKDVILRFAATYHLQQVHYVFDTFIKGAEIKHNTNDLAFYMNLPKHKRDVFENTYHILQDRRNMLIHDLWRVDPIGLANILMLLVHVFDPLLLESSLEVIDESSTDQTNYSIQSSNLEAGTRSADYAHPNPTELLIDHFRNDTATPRIVDALLMRGANIDAEVFNGYRPIHLAIINNDLRMLKLLLSLGANPNTFDYRGNFPLHIAAENDNREAAQLLLNYGAVPMPGSYTPYDVAIHYGHPLVRELLKPYRPILRGDPANRLIRAVKELELAEVQAALREGVEVNLHNEDGELSLVQALAKINYVEYDEEELAKAVAIVAELVKAGADVTLSELGGKHALTAVSEYDMLDLARCVYGAATDVNISDQKGDTALHIAAARQHETLVAELLKRNARVNLVSPLYDTSLLAAINIVIRRSKSIQQMLLANGANPNYQKKFVGAPLHFMAQDGDIESAELLLHFGANPFLRNYGRKLPIDVAKDYKMKRLLYEWMQYLLSKVNPNETRPFPWLASFSALRKEGKHAHHSIRYPDSERIDINQRPYVWNVPGGTVIHFRAGEVVGDGDCAFTALGTTRIDAINLIRNNTNIEWVRTLIRPDILARIIDPTDTRILPPILNTLRLRLRDRHNELMNRIEQIRAQVNQALHLEGEEALARDQLADHIAIEEEANKFRQDLIELNTIADEIEAFNPTQDEVNAFLQDEFIDRHEYLTYHRGGGGTLEALARLKGIGVTILTGENNLAQTLNIPPPPGIEEHYYLHHTGFKNDKRRMVLNHFNLLYRDS